MRVTKSLVIQVASDLADQNGLNLISLKAVADKLNIRTPSLYNHIDSLDDLLRAVAHKGMSEVNEQMAQAAIGVTGDAAIKAVGLVYLNYMFAHPGIYETIQWASWHGTEETTSIYENYTTLLITLIHSCHFEEAYTHKILDLLTGIFHGYTSMQLRYVLTTPEETRSEFIDAIDTVLTGARQKYSSVATQD